MSTLTRSAASSTERPPERTAAWLAPLLLQVSFVGAALGTARTIIPSFAEQDFGIAPGSFLLLTSFILGFGLAKALLNLAAGALAQGHGAARILLLGWLLGLPIPLMLALASHWATVVAAMLLLGTQQGLCWSCTQILKLQRATAAQRGRVLALNEFGGYVGMSLAALASAALAQTLGARWSLVLGTALMMLGGLLFSLPLQTQSERPGLAPGASTASGPLPRLRLTALMLAGHVEKFVDVLVWLFVPLFLQAKGLSLTRIGSIVAAYSLSWGLAQLFTGSLSDRYGRYVLNVGGMAICAAGACAVPWLHEALHWMLAMVVCGLGMAMLYPNLGAAVADAAPGPELARQQGWYRFWRDLGYVIGAGLLGALAWLSGDVRASFVGVGICMLASLIILAMFTREDAHAAT